MLLDHYLGMRLILIRPIDHHHHLPSHQVKHLYGDGHIPEIAAKPGDDTLYVNIWDKVLTITIKKSHMNEKQ